MNSPLSTSGEKLFSEKLQEYLNEQPNECDVTFLVGPTKEKVRAVRLILVVASLQFRKLFEEKWDLAPGNKKYNGIVIADVDAEAFKILLKLLPLEHLTPMHLEKYEFKADQILNLCQICQRFGMYILYRSFEEMKKPFFKFNTIVLSSQFLQLSAKNLASILASDDNDNNPLDEIEIFSHVCRWAKHQCSTQNLEATQRNMRTVLGDCLREIRFPIMSIKDFGKTVCAENILTDEETSRIFRFISLDEEDRKSLNISSLGFKCYRRNEKISKKPMGISTIQVYKDLKLINNPFYVCNGELSVDWFSVDKKIELLGVGFPGPVNCDGEYVILVEVKCFSIDKIYTSEKMEETIPAKCQQSIQFMFEKPFVCIPSDGSYTYNIGVYYNLKGPNMQVEEKYKDITLDVTLARTQDDIKFGFGLQSKQILELIFRKL